MADSVSDFWQMVWEQGNVPNIHITEARMLKNMCVIPAGSVVLVLLTRLNENGQSLCYNYWPEEGSQLYHIYEV